MKKYVIRLNKFLESILLPEKLSEKKERLGELEKLSEYYFDVKLIGDYSNNRNLLNRDVSWKKGMINIVRYVRYIERYKGDWLITNKELDEEEGIIYVPRTKKDIFNFGEIFFSYEDITSDNKEKLEFSLYGNINGLFSFKIKTEEIKKDLMILARYHNGL